MIVDAKLAAGGIAPVPVRLTAAEQVLTGKKKRKEAAHEAFDAAMKDASPMRENAYKLQELRVQLERSLEA